uniref:Uncharacterized protein n=1 Tax=Panagrolaimus sp. ES5 TaxID=591445 RepID=A0AC34GEW3_9BILA
MASHGILPYEKEELKNALEEQYSNIRNTITKRFYQQEQIVGRWISFIQPSNNDISDSNATIAHPKRSDKSSLDRLNNAGETLMKKEGKINIDENNFEGDISSASNVSAYMSSMFATLQKLNKSGLILSENDIKFIVSNILEQTITNIGNINESIQKEWKSPIIDTKNGSTMAWVKFVFTLTNSIREAFYSTDFIKIKVKTYYFSFSNEQELQAALK